LNSTSTKVKIWLRNIWRLGVHPGCGMLA
jgi:hypothetical protein